MENDPGKEEKIKKDNLSGWLAAISIVVILFFLYRGLQGSSFAKWLDIANFQGSELSFGVSFLVGLVASVSTCLAVVGGMIIAFSEKYKSGGKSFFESVVRPNIFFHIGRITTFFLLGGILGIVGGTLNISGNFVSAYTVIIATIMAWLGLSILGIIPSISALGLRPPRILVRFWARTEISEHKAAPFILGGLTFFLPCGFTQSMQILALVSGSFLAGGMILFFFAVGTMPVLLGLGVATSWFRARKFETFQKAAGLAIIAFAVFTFQSALALRGVKTNVIGSAGENNHPADQRSGPSNSPSQEQQTVEMSVTGRGFEPSTLRIKKGVPVKWIVKGVSVSGCTNKILVPSLNIAENIKTGENIISFVPSDAREIPFSCGMGMVRGKFIVE